MTRAILAFSILLFSIAVPNKLFAKAVTPSFVCNNRLTPIESLICSNENLSDDDREMARLYRSLRQIRAGDNQENVVLEQRLWLSDLKNTCGRLAQSPNDNMSAVQCIDKKYRGRIELITQEITQKLPKPGNTTTSSASNSDNGFVGNDHDGAATSSNYGDTRLSTARDARDEIKSKTVDVEQGTKTQEDDFRRQISEREKKDAAAKDMQRRVLAYSIAQQGNNVKNLGFPEEILRKEIMLRDYDGSYFKFLSMGDWLALLLEGGDYSDIHRISDNADNNEGVARKGAGSPTTILTFRPDGDELYLVAAGSGDKVDDLQEGEKTVMAVNLLVEASQIYTSKSEAAK